MTFITWTEMLVNVAADEIAKAKPTNDDAKRASDQFKALRAAASQIAATGAFGDDNARFNVHLTGSVCPKHRNADGRRDLGSVTVTQVTAGDFEVETLIDATEDTEPILTDLQAIFAHDVGATDSGINDEGLRTRRLKEWNALDSDEREERLDIFAARIASAEGYTTEDAQVFREWLTKQ